MVEAGVVVFRSGTERLAKDAVVALGVSADAQRVLAVEVGASVWLVDLLSLWRLNGFAIGPGSVEEKSNRGSRSVTGGH